MGFTPSEKLLRHVDSKGPLDHIRACMTTSGTERSEYLVRQNAELNVLVRLVFFTSRISTSLRHSRAHLALVSKGCQLSEPRS